jgi:hypothetical protein
MTTEVESGERWEGTASIPLAQARSTGDDSGLLGAMGHGTCRRHIHVGVSGMTPPGLCSAQHTCASGFHKGRGSLCLMR